jgi:hypothetical protein
MGSTSPRDSSVATPLHIYLHQRCRPHLSPQKRRRDGPSRASPLSLVLGLGGLPDGSPAQVEVSGTVYWARDRSLAEQFLTGPVAPP